MSGLFNRDREAQPEWATRMVKRWPGGLCRGVNGSVWVYHKVPLGPEDDARDVKSMLRVAEPHLSAYRELARMTRTRSDRRRMVRSAMREVHVLLVNVPQPYLPGPEQPLRPLLARQHHGAQIDNRLLLFGVKIRDDWGASQGWTGRAVSMYETFAGDGVPLEDFDADAQVVQRALKRAGLLEPTEADFALADAWWNSGRNPETPFLPHDDHLHAFTDHASLAVAEALVADDEPCEDWPARMPGHHVLSMLAYRNLEFQARDARDGSSRWASAIRQQGAVAISIRGLLEPPKVTHGELRRNRNRFRSDIREQQAADKMERDDLHDISARLRQREADYAQEGALPTLIDASVIVALSGVPEAGRFDADGLTPDTVSYSNMLAVQDRALEETMLCSNVRANPTLKDLPVQTVAYSGITSMSVVGDATGALLGFTERDHRPAYVSHAAAYEGDGLPLMLVAGATGSGKLLELSTKLPTPLTSTNASGFTTIGEVRVGDTVFGRDGKPCKVTYISPTNEMPNLYELTFSDGQKLVADAEHQWVVSNFADRNTRHKSHRKAAIARREAMLGVADELWAATERFDPSHQSTLPEILEVTQGVPGTPWNSPLSVYQVLDFMGCPTSTQPRTWTSSFAQREVVKSDPVQLFNIRALLEANIERWESTTGGNAVRWGAQSQLRVAAARKVLAGIGDDQRGTVQDISRRLVAAGAPRVAGNRLASVARDAGVVSVSGRADVTIPLPATRTSTRDLVVYPTAVALKCLSERIRQQFHDEPIGHVTEQRMTTAEMLAEGLTVGPVHSNFAIGLTGALDLPEVELPVPPYALGAWLGDGDSIGGGFTGVDSFITDEIARCGYEVTHSATIIKRHHIKGLVKHLRAAGVLNNKHIPALYQRASIEQRLELLRGIMDTDGTISPNGRCELGLCNGTLAADALQLIRGLGIKAAMTSGIAAYTVTDPDTGEKTRTVTGTRYRINFTTDKPVFALPRKAERLPAPGTLRDTQQWLYITSIEPVESRPGRCIQVDSVDHTYLAGEGFIPSSNTMVMLNLAYQWAHLDPQIPQIIVDPKASSDHSDVVLAAGGRVVSLDDLTSADGVFDALRFASNREAGVAAATDILTQLRPGWTEDEAARFEAEVPRALKHGVDKGATCIGQALTIALEDGVASQRLVSSILDQVESYPIFRACVGMNPDAEGLRVGRGITYIKTGGVHLSLPAPGRAPEGLAQRVTVALIKMMVFGSAMALTGRNGVLHFDEAWVAMAGGATEVERLGRLARSQAFLPILYTQRVSDAVDNGLAGYISRGLIMHISDEEEAQAACKLFKLEPGLRVPRITAPNFIGGSTADIEGSLNWASLKALVEPGTRDVKRGAVAIYCDLKERAVPTVVSLSPEFLRIASTNPDDIAAKSKHRLGEQFQAQEKNARLEEVAGSSESYRRMQDPDEPVEPVTAPADDPVAEDLGDLFLDQPV